MSDGRNTQSCLKEREAVPVRWYGADADRCVLDGVHIGAIWRIQLSRPCVAAMRPNVKLF